MGILYTHHCTRNYVDVIAQTLTTLSKLWLIAQHVYQKIFPVSLPLYAILQSNWCT